MRAENIGESVMDKDFSKQIKKYLIMTFGVFLMQATLIFDNLWGKHSNYKPIIYLDQFLILVGAVFVLYGVSAAFYLEKYFQINEGKEGEYAEYSFSCGLQGFVWGLSSVVMIYFVSTKNGGDNAFSVTILLMTTLALIFLPGLIKPSKNYGEFEKSINTTMMLIVLKSLILIGLTSLLLFKIFPGFYWVAVSLFHNNAIDMFSYLFSVTFILATLTSRFAVWLKYR